MRKVILTEDMFKRLLSENIISESDLSGYVKSAELDKKVRDVVKNDKQLEKDIEKKVKKIVSQAVENLFRALWFKKDIYKNDIEK